MRRFLLLAGVLGLSASGAAYAQAATCEASADKDGVGELIAEYEMDKTGQVTRLVGTWVPERKEGVGIESDNFARPSMMLEYRFGSEGALVGPTAAIITSNRFQSPGGAAPPPMTTVEYRVTIAGADPIKWAGNTNGGDKPVAEAIRNNSPKSLKAELLTKSGGKVLAMAEWDLTKLPEAQKLADKAKADGDRRVASFVKLAADGKAGDTCPAK